ncbi:hypothetical protein LOAG_04895 [Loa loa]|uniref:Uncharacterized protein n=1 Tax=Loa loa TaxID=7209 RepID=A0A1S0U164_LOALO|nr:hypothetical protein LOAG_04895 [Loa loa]EFO23594.1 hypothetical protein LOAG_04895 [Loa loa]
MVSSTAVEVEVINGTDLNVENRQLTQRGGLLPLLLLLLLLTTTAATAAAITTALHAYMQSFTALQRSVISVCTTPHLCQSSIHLYTDIDTHTHTEEMAVKAVDEDDDDRTREKGALQCDIFTDDSKSDDNIAGDFFFIMFKNT